MKTLFLITTILLFFSCEKSDDIINNDVTGTYSGTLTGDFKESATTTVINIGDQIQVHCVTENFDATVILDIYDNNNLIMVCLTGEEFQNMYGHMPGHGDMNHNMQNHDAGWIHHLNNEHQEGDEHFGNFDMQNHTFNYTFRMNNGDFHFEGERN